MENRYFGQNLVKLRKERHLSQNDLAIELNVTISAISKWENNKNMPDIDMLKTLSKFFETPLDELLRNPEEDFLQEIKPADSDLNSSESGATLEPAPSSTKKISRPILITAVCILVLVMIAVAIGIFAKANQQPAMPFRIMNSRTVEDEVWGTTTTEISVYYESTLNNSLMSMICTYIERQWAENGEYGGKSVETLKVYFYSDKTSAKNFAPGADSYMFLFDRETYPE